MNSRLYFLCCFSLLSACMPIQKPSSDAFVQSELMPPKIEEAPIIEAETKNNEQSILEEILAAIKAPLVSSQPAAKQETVQEPQKIQQPVQAPAQQPVTSQQSAQPALQTPPPVVLPQTSPNIMPQILQAAPSGTSSPFFQTIVLPQMAPFGYPAPMAPVQQPIQQAPFYSTPNQPAQNQTAQAPTQNSPVSPVNQPQTQQNSSMNFEAQTTSTQQSVQQAQTYQEPVANYQAPRYVEYQESAPVYIEKQPSQNNYYPESQSAEVILPETYQLPPVQNTPTHVISGQEAYPIWQSDTEAYYEEVIPAPAPVAPVKTETSSLKSENINIPRW